MKTVLCFGDSNTYGYIPQTDELRGETERYGVDVRWPRRLGALLGGGYDVVEEGLNGRATAFFDELEPYRCALDTVLPILMSHEPVDLLILMLGTNDTKRRYNVSPGEIARGLGQVIRKVAGLYLFRPHMPRILVVAPVPLGEVSPADWMFDAASREKSAQLAPLYAATAKQLGCAFFDAGSVIHTLGSDGVHFTAEDHALLAEALAAQVRALLENA